MKHTLIVTTESRSVRGFQQGNDVGIVVADGIECIKAGVVWIIHIRLTFIAGGEAPATIPVVVRFFSVAIANLAALNHDSVCCQASVCAGPVRKKRFHLFFRDIEVFVSAARFVEIFTNLFAVLGHCQHVFIIHQFPKIVIERILGKV